jgi:predicted DNA-binding protein (MmcQ/YjbR family)
MNYPWFDEFCQSLKGAEKDFKEEWNATRYMIRGKMFSLQGGDKVGKPVITLPGYHPGLLHEQRTLELSLSGRPGTG